MQNPFGPPLPKTGAIDSAMMPGKMPMMPLKGSMINKKPNPFAKAPKTKPVAKKTTKKKPVKKGRC